MIQLVAGFIVLCLAAAALNLLVLSIRNLFRPRHAAHRRRYSAKARKEEYIPPPRVWHGPV